MNINELIVNVKKKLKKNINIENILIEDKREFIEDMLGRQGYLHNIGDLYLFKPIDLDDGNNSIYNIKNPLSFKNKKITFELDNNVRLKLKDDLQFAKLVKKIKNIRLNFIKTENKFTSEELVSEFLNTERAVYVINNKNNINNFFVELVSFKYFATT